MRYAAHGNEARCSGPNAASAMCVSGGSDRERLTQVAQAVYDQTEKSGG